MFTIGENGRTFSQSIIDLLKEHRHEELRTYIQGKSPSELVDDSKTTLLHLAVKYSSWSLIRYLIEIGCDINAETASKTTPLMVAIECSNINIARLLIDANADIYVKNSSGKSALQLLLNNKDMGECLIRHCIEKIKCNVQSDKTVADILYAAKCPISVTAFISASIKETIINNYVSELSKPHVEIDISNPDNISFLNKMHPHWHNDESCLPLISIFLERATNWNSLRAEDLNCLELFFLHGSKQMLEVFLQHNVNEYVRQRFPGRDLFINIFGNCHADARELLKNLKFDINSRNSEGFTALHMALDTVDALANVKTLLDLGADPNIKTQSGDVPLSLVYEVKGCNCNNSDWNERKIIELLLLAGADPQLAMRGGKAMWLAFSSSTKTELLIAQLAIDKSLNKPIDEKIIRYINHHEHTCKIYKECYQKLEKLKTVPVHGSMTLYTILAIDPSKITVRNREVIEAITLRSDVEEWCCYYVSRLKDSVQKILHVMDLRMKASKFICEITGWPSSQYIIIENIISFLNYRDLLVFDKLDCEESM